MIWVAKFHFRTSIFQCRTGHWATFLHCCTECYDILRQTDWTSVSFWCAEAVRQVSDVASHINDHIKQQDNFMRMLAIQKSLACPVGPRILVPGRVFIKEGQLKKVSDVTFW